MASFKEFEGFVPVTILTRGHRIDGLLFKERGKRVVEQLETDPRALIPIALAEVMDVQGTEEPIVADGIAVHRDAIEWLIPHDAVRPAPVWQVWDWESQAGKPMDEWVAQTQYGIEPEPATE